MGVFEEFSQSIALGRPQRIDSLFGSLLPMHWENFDGEIPLQSQTKSLPPVLQIHNVRSAELNILLRPAFTIFGRPNALRRYEAGYVADGMKRRYMVEV